MPPSRIRQQLASEISTLQIFTTINSDTDSDLEDLLGFLQYINEKQYLQQQTFDSRPLVYDLSTLESLCPNTFTQICRTTHDSFKQLFNLVKDDPAFHNSSLNHQRDPSIQLATGLCRLGSNGNGAAVRKISTLFGFGYGTTVLYTSRTIKVIIKLKKKFLTWPTITKRSESSLVSNKKDFLDVLDLSMVQLFPSARNLLLMEMFIGTKRKGIYFTQINIIIIIQLTIFFLDF